MGCTGSNTHRAPRSVLPLSHHNMSGRATPAHLVICLNPSPSVMQARILALKCLSCILLCWHPGWELQDKELWDQLLGTHV